MMVHQEPALPYTPCKTPSRRSSAAAFTPSRSSPLSPRPPSMLNSSPLSSSTKPPPAFVFSDPNAPPSPPRSPNFLAPRRLFKPNPLVRTPDTRRSARRDMFLKKVENGRFDKTMKARGGEDEMMRMIYVAEQKRWAQNLEMSAQLAVPTILEEEEEEELAYDPEEENEKLAELARQAELESAALTMEPPTEDGFDEYLDHDGQDLEELMAHMDLDLDTRME